MDDNFKDQTPKNPNENINTQSDDDSVKVNVTTSSPVSSENDTKPDVEPITVKSGPSPSSAFGPAAPLTNQFRRSEPISSAESSSTPTTAPVVSSPDISESPSPDSTPPVSHEPVVVAHRHPRRRRLLTALLLLILVILAGAAAWWLMNDKEKETETTTTTVQNVDVINYGSVEGPIGKNSTFPNPVTVALQNTINQQIYEGLVGYREQKIIPLVASSWKNTDESTWIFTIRPNVTFQNGKKVTAESVKASLDALKKNEGWGVYVSTIKSVEVEDASHVKIVTNQPDPLLLNRLATAFIYDTTNTDKNVLPAGTGAYTLVADKSNNDSIVTLKPYDDYYLGVPKTRSLVFTVYENDDKLLEATKAGKVDVLDQTKNTEYSKELTSRDFTEIDSESPGSYSLQFNMVSKTSAVTNIKVRQAVAYALNRADLIKELDAPYEPANHLIPQAVLGYDGSAKVPDQDIAKAKALQKEAGYPNGAPVTVAYIKDLQLEMPVVIKQLQAAGFNVTPKAAESPDVMVATIQAGTFDIVGFSTSTDYSDGGDYFTQLISSTGANFPLYNIPEVDKMIKESNEEFDATARIKQLQEINKYAIDNFLAIPVRNTVYSNFHRSNLTYSFDFNAVSPATYFWNVGQKVAAKNN